MADELRPSYVQFETRSIEDREATIAAGHYVGKDVVYALVTPAGSKDRVEAEAEAWIANVEEGVKTDRIPHSWLEYYRNALKAFRESRDAPETGTAIMTWPGASVAQIKLLLDINVRTVEELAVANEETVQRIGMGGRALKQKAVTWLETSDGQGKIVEEIQALRVRNLELEARDAEREKDIKELQTQIKALMPKTKAKEEA